MLASTPDAVDATGPWEPLIATPRLGPMGVNPLPWWFTAGAIGGMCVGVPLVDALGRRGLGGAWLLLTPLAFTGAVIGAAGLVRGRTEIVVCEKGLALRSGRSTRNVLWRDIASVAVAEYAQDTTGRWLQVRVELSQNSTFEACFRVPFFSELQPDSVALNFIAMLHKQVTAKFVDAWRERLHRGEMLDFGVARLSLNELHLWRAPIWRKFALSSGRAGSGASMQMDRHAVSSGPFRNPLIFRQLLSELVPGPNPVEESTWGGIAAVHLACR